MIRFGKITAILHFKNSAKYGFGNPKEPVKYDEAWLKQFYKP